MSIVVKKFGGSSLANTEMIKSAAQSLAKAHDNGKQVVAVVSAMGSTTNELLNLANQITDTPNRRELDMLISTGERVSMSLLSMALNDLGYPAISFTGSQAGVLTDNSHTGARIIDVKAFRIEQELQKGKIVILAGFQGVCPETKEITTLGRGGTDTTAIAISCYLKAKQCEILKDVDGVLSADPKIVKNTKHLEQLSYDEMLEMAYWGAKLTHYRCVELAKSTDTNIIIGLAHGNGKESRISMNSGKYEMFQLLAINSHPLVFKFKADKWNLHQVHEAFDELCNNHKLPWPQILTSEDHGDYSVFYITQSEEILSSYKKYTQSLSNLEWDNTDYTNISLTYHGAVQSEISYLIIKKLEDAGIKIIKQIQSSITISFIISENFREKAIKLCHSFIESND